MLRLPSHRHSIETALERVQEIAESMAKDIPVSNIEDFKFTQTDNISSEMRILINIAENLREKLWQIHLIDDDELSLVVSDRPFLVTHPDGGPGFYFDIDTPNVEIYVPLHDRALLVGKNEISPVGVLTATPQLIGLVNTKLILSANRFFYSSRGNILLVDDNLDVYFHSVAP